MQRYLHTTATCLRKAASSSTPKVVQKAPGKPSKRDLVLQEGHQWLNGDGKRFDLISPRNWLHPKRPFPKNPWFVPPVPVGDSVREEIYSTYLSDPKQWTPRQLAMKFELSVIRIEAILRLKHLEKKQEKEGYVLQRRFADEMERLMGVDSSDTTLKLREKPTLFVDPPGKMTDTTTEKLSFDRRADGNYILPLSGVISAPEAPTRVLEKENPREANRRWKFIIADVSSQKSDQDRTIVVRDNDGMLRTATNAERRMHLQLYPTSVHKKKQDNALWEI